MRTREVREGMNVEVRHYATGDAQPFRGLVGTVLSASGSDTPYVDFGPSGKVFIQARWLVATDREPEPATPASQELDAFKRKVAEVAQRYGREHGLCEVVDDALKELGIEPRLKGKIRIVFEIPEEKFEPFVDQGDDVMERIVDYFTSIFEEGLYRERLEWFTEAGYVEGEK